MTTELPVLDQKSNTVGSPGFMQSGCNPDAKCGNGLEKIYPTCAVRYGYMRYLGEFRYSPGMKFNCGGKVVIQSNRGIELGEQVSLTCSGCDKSINRKQILEYIKNSGPEFMQLKAGRILRVATPADLDDQLHLNMSAAQKLLFARKLAVDMNLPMKFVTCEHLLGGERIIFHFMSEDRIDFREPVRILAQEYHTRIEMHQVGARDEARLVADYEICGRECCCKNFLKKLRQVNMKMAKLQKATLDPSKVSGRCGRLRCCLRYEHEGYEELNAKLPRVGSRIRTEKGTATVKNRQILTQLLSIQYDGTEEWESIPLEDVVEKGLPKLDLPEMDGPPQRDQRPQREGRDQRDQNRHDEKPREDRPRDDRPRDDRPRPDRPPRPPAPSRAVDPEPIDETASIEFGSEIIDEINPEPTRSNPPAPADFAGGLLEDEADSGELEIDSDSEGEGDVDQPSEGNQDNSSRRQDSPPGESTDRPRRRRRGRRRRGGGPGGNAPGGNAGGGPPTSGPSGPGSS